MTSHRIEASGEIENVTIGNTIDGIELETRNRVFIRVSKVAYVMALKDSGPCRIIFDAGGHVDVCGAAGEWAVLLRLHELQDSGAQ